MDFCLMSWGATTIYANESLFCQINQHILETPLTAETLAQLPLLALSINNKLHFIVIRECPWGGG